MTPPRTADAPAAMPGTSGRVVRLADAASEWSGRVVAWLTLPLALVLAAEVVSRYGFNKPTAWAYDITYMLYGAHFMLCAAFTLKRGGHIRTDFVYRLLPVRVQGALDALLYLVLFLPALSLFLWASIDFASDSWRQLERSFESPWMPPIYPLKTVLPVSATLLIIQGVAELLKSVHAMRHGRWP